MEEHRRLKDLSNTSPGGLLQITTEPGRMDRREASSPTSTESRSPAAPRFPTTGLDGCARRELGGFTSDDPHPQALHETGAATAARWFPSNPWRLRPGPSIVAVLEHNEDFTTAPLRTLAAGGTRPIRIAQRQADRVRSGAPGRSNQHSHPSCRAAVSGDPRKSHISRNGRDRSRGCRRRSSTASSSCLSSRARRPRRPGRCGSVGLRRRMRETARHLNRVLKQASESRPRIP